MCNVIASLLYARRFEYDDPHFIRLLNLLKETLKEESGFLPMVRGSGVSVPRELHTVETLREVTCRSDRRRAFWEEMDKHQWEGRG